MADLTASRGGIVSQPRLHHWYDITTRDAFEQAMRVILTLSVVTASNVEMGLDMILPLTHRRYRLEVASNIFCFKQYARQAASKNSLICFSILHYVSKYCKYQLSE